MNKNGSGFASLLIAFALLYVFIYNFDGISNFFSASKDTLTKTSNKTTHIETTTQKNRFIVKDTVNVIKKMSIYFKSCGEYNINNNMFFQPKEGKKFIYCEFEFENISEEYKLVTPFDFECYADNISCNQTYLGNDLTAINLSPGRKVSGKIYFEVPQNAKNIEIEYYNGLVYSDKIIFIYK